MFLRVLWLAAEIAIEELAQSKFGETTMCVIGELAKETYKKIDQARLMRIGNKQTTNNNNSTLLFCCC